MRALKLKLPGVWKHSNKTQNKKYKSDTTEMMDKQYEFTSQCSLRMVHVL